MAAAELEDVGEVVIEEADIVSDWQRPSFDIARQTIGVLDGDRLVAYAEVAKGRRADAAVHPDHRGRGIGTALALWTQRISRRDGQGLVGQPAPEGSAGERLFRALGYEVLWTSWVLEMPRGKTIEPQPIPEGYTVREEVKDEADHRAAHEVVEDAFLEWSERDRESFEDFAAGTILRPGFEPWHLRLMIDPSARSWGCRSSCTTTTSATSSGSPSAGTTAGWGSPGLCSSTPSPSHGARRNPLRALDRLSTGALGLYEKVGMETTSVWRHWAIDTSGQG